MGLSVKIYKSQAGKKAEKENKNILKKGDDEEDFSREALREFELSKLRWFYAIVETDSVKTAERISEECDGREYMSSSTLVEFSDDPEDEYFDGKIEDSKECHPLQLNHSSMSHTAVSSTFDEKDARRGEIFDKAFKDFG